MSVRTEHPEYTYHHKLWRMVRDAAAGEHKVKAGRELYLPKIPGYTESDYDAYMSRAYFLGVTGRTRDALIGMVFRRPAQYDVPEALQFLLEDVDGAGQSIEQLAKESTLNLLETGRHILMVDHSGDGTGLDAESERRLGLRPVIVPYKAEALINWRTQRTGGREQLVLAVLYEQVEDGINEFHRKLVDRYRVLRLRDGVYTQQIYGDLEKPIGDEIVIRQAGGAPFDHIPIQIVGSRNNKAGVDDAPLYDLAVINLSQYRNIADAEDSAHHVGQPMLHVDIGDTPPDVFASENPDGIAYGSRRGVVTQGGRVEIVQPREVSEPRSLKIEKDGEMVKIGARLIQRGGQAETAEAARINASAEASTLDLLVGNLSEALEACLEDCARFLGVNVESVEYQLNRSYWESSLDPQTMMAMIQAGDAGIIARSDQRHMIRQGRIELADGRTDDEIDAEIEGQGVL